MLRKDCVCSSLHAGRAGHQEELVFLWAVEGLLFENALTETCSVPDEHSFFGLRRNARGSIPALSLCAQLSRGVVVSIKHGSNRDDCVRPNTHACVLAVGSARTPICSDRLHYSLDGRLLCFQLYVAAMVSDAVSAVRPLQGA